METRTFSASLEYLHEMLRFVRIEAQKMGFSRSDQYKIELAAEEAIVNVIHHSYQDKGGDVSISIDSADGLLKVTISDMGLPFNPLAQKLKVHSKESLQERQPGGLGLIFIRKCLDEVSYERKNNQNILMLIKKCRSH